jgi:diguanylate cyclase (GGDEF)-like protein
MKAEPIGVPIDPSLNEFLRTEGLSLETLLKSASEAVLFVDSNWVARYCNEIYAAAMGLTPDQVVGRTPFEYTPTDFRRSIFFEACEQCVVHRKPTSKIAYSTSMQRWVLARGFPVRGGALLLANDATEGVVKAYHLAQAAVRDQLTGLGNTYALQEWVDEATPKRIPFTLALLWVRRFQDINAAHGYATGELVLMELASRLQTSTRDSDRLYRVSTDEFALVMQGNPAAAHDHLRTLVPLFGPAVEVQGLRIPVTVGIGTASSPTHGSGCDQLLKRAGLALSEGKRQTTSAFPVVTFRPEMELQARYRSVMESELRQCLDGSQFTLDLQPKVSLTTGEVVGAEALIRWKHPQRGVLAPGAWLPIAKDLGVMRCIDTWVLRQALVYCKHLRAWGADIPISVNLSADALADPTLPQMLEEALLMAEVPASMLEIEIPEGDLMVDVQASVHTLRALAAMNVRLSIDDFGTGFSSFAYLAQFPVNDLKIDRSFVNGLEADEVPRKIVKSIIRLAHSLGLGVVAEGAESAAQLAALRRYRCDAVQGFAVSRALPLPEFREYCARRVLLEPTPDPFSL